MSRSHTTIAFLSLLAVAPPRHAGAQEPKATIIAAKPVTSVTEGYELCVARKSILQTMKLDPENSEHLKPILVSAESRIREHDQGIYKGTGIRNICVLLSLRLGKASLRYDLLARNRLIEGSTMLGIGSSGILGSFILLLLCNESRNGYREEGRAAGVAMMGVGAGLLAAGIIRLAVGSSAGARLRNRPSPAPQRGPKLTGFSISF